MKEIGTSQCRLGPIPRFFCFNLILGIFIRVVISLVMEKSTKPHRKRRSKNTTHEPDLEKTDPIDMVEKYLSEIEILPMPSRYSMEIMLGHFDGDVPKTVKSFQTGDANEILSHWKRKSTKHKDKITSTPADVYDTSSISLFSSPTSSKNFIVNTKKHNDHVWNLFNLLENKKSSYETKLFASWTDESKKSYYKDQISVVNQQQLELIRNMASTDYTTDQSSIAERITQLEQTINVKLLPLIDHEPELYDPWLLTSRTRYQQDTFKLKLVHFYQRQSEDKPDSIRCMVMDIDFPSESIIASHIWPASTNGRGLRRFNLDSKCLNDSRNGLLLHKLIEKAFDRKQICFIFDEIDECLKVKLLCPHIKNNEIERGVKFNQINGRKLQLPKGVWPFRRLLNWHAIRSYEYARNESWIDSQETLTDYYHISDNKLEMPGCV